MTKYVLLDANSQASAFYESTIHTTIPPAAIEITDILWQQWIDSTSPVCYVPATKSLQAYVTPVVALTSAQLTPLVNSACANRIYAVASANAQMNMTAYVASGTVTPPDLAAFQGSLAWVAEMRTACQALIAAADATYALDSHWPICPADVAALAARF